MNYHNITKDDMLNGDGLRVVLWVAGCGHACPGCHNPITWDPDGGLPFTDKEKEEIFQQLSQDYISGLTLSGGDPLFPANRDAVGKLMNEVKQAYPHKTIWLYTGYLWEEIQDLPFISLADVVVDGKFQQKWKQNTLKWKGSRNQRVIDVKETMKRGEVILHADN